MKGYGVLARCRAVFGCARNSKVALVTIEEDNVRCGAPVGFSNNAITIVVFATMGVFVSKSIIGSDGCEPPEVGTHLLFVGLYTRVERRNTAPEKVKHLGGMPPLRGAKGTRGVTMGGCFNKLRRPSSHKRSDKVRSRAT